MEISKHDADSLFRKWMDERTSINLVINIGAARGSVTGVISHIESDFVVLSHLTGQFHILLIAASFNYQDAREGPQSVRDAYPEFVSGLQLNFKFGECIFAEVTGATAP